MTLYGSKMIRHRLESIGRKLCRLFLIAMGIGISVGSISFVSAGEKDTKNGRPVVVELFTSQGCNSCPPAEAYLNRLADRENVIALEFHVDYWDYIGWKDPYAAPEFTKRQKSYVSPLGMRYVYTPQMVINGRSHEVGSRERAVEFEIEQALADEPLSFPIVTVSHGSETLDIQIEANGHNVDTIYDIIVVSFDDRHETEITRGENRGKTLVSSNIVRDMHVVGTWTGGDMSANLHIDNLRGDGGCAVLLQKQGGGEILAAAMLNLG